MDSIVTICENIRKANEGKYAVRRGEGRYVTENNPWGIYQAPVTEAKVFSSYQEALDYCGTSRSMTPERLGDAKSSHFTGQMSRSIIR